MHAKNGIIQLKYRAGNRYKDRPARFVKAKSPPNTIIIDIISMLMIFP